MGKMQRDVMVAGVGMVPFTKPSARVPYDLMGEQAIRMACEKQCCGARTAVVVDVDDGDPRHTRAIDNPLPSATVAVIGAPRGGSADVSRPTRPVRLAQLRLGDLAHGG